MDIEPPPAGEAQQARALLLRDRAAGERAFAALLAKSPRQGWIYFLRGGAFEAVGDPGRAAEDYAAAVDLLPPGERRDVAQAALERVTSCRGDTVR